MKYEAVVQEYLLVNPRLPDYKKKLNFLLEVINELEISYIYVHSDEMVYSKLCEILCKNKNMYTKIILLMGDFYQLGVMQQLLYKCHILKV